ncbi:MAG: hypothetical protein KC547_15560, partial [Anaerolineae bacterium]|nr:hypothetical protein [Anaerolineae bacterium]
MMKQSLIVIILCVLLAALPVMAQDVVPSVSPYDLGAATFVDADEQSVSYSLSGVLGVPVGAGPFPVALILHGSYPACFDGDTPVSEAEAIYPCADGQVEARYDIAWQSLADALAARGYLTLIPNLNAAWSVTPHNADYALEIAERHLAALLAATQGQNVSFPEPLNGLADWNQLAVIGHDTGAASAALMTWTRGTLGEEADVDALVLVNASAELATQNTALPDIPTLVVLGECARESRDAGTDYAGQLHFEAARQSPVRETPALSVLVDGANRNYFMTGDELLITDDYGAGFGDDTACLPESEGRLTRDQQPVLIQQLAAAFLDTVLLGQPVEANIGLDPLQPAPTEIFGFSVRTALLAPSIQRLAIMQPQTGPSVIVNALGGDVVTEGDVGIAVCLNDFACNGGLAPSGQPAAAYISSRYESSLAFTLPEPRQDLRMFDGIHFRFAFDPLSRLNAMGEKLGFEVTVTDKAGNTAVY